jgi:hypothetical protein
MSSHHNGWNEYVKQLKYNTSDAIGGTIDDSSVNLFELELKIPNNNNTLEWKATTRRG